MNHPDDNECSLAETDPSTSEKAYSVSRGRSVLLMVVLFLLFTLCYMDRFVMSAVVEPMKADLGLSDAQAGFLQTVFMIGLAFLMIPSGLLVDRWRGRKAVRVMANREVAFGGIHPTKERF